MKTMFLTRLYPSQYRLLNILYERNQFYMTLLEGELINNLVEQLWITEYKCQGNLISNSSIYRVFTKRIMGESKALQNKQGSTFKSINQNEYLDHNDNKSKSLNTLLNKFKKTISKNVESQYSRGINVLFSVNQLKSYKKYFFFKQLIPNIKKVNKDSLKKRNAYLQYQIWKNCCIKKFQIELLFYLLFSFLVMIIFDNIHKFRVTIIQISENTQLIDLLSMNMLNKDYRYWFSSSVINQYIYPSFFEKQFCMDIKQQNEQLYGNCLYYCELLRKLKDDLFYLFSIQYFYLLTFIYSLCQVYANYKSLNKIIIDFKNIIETMLFVLNSTILYQQSTGIHTAIPLSQLLDNLNILGNQVILLIFLVWMKLFAYLKLFRQFGVIIRIIEIILIDLINFFIVYMINVLAFSTIFFIRYNEDNVDFETMFISVRTLISASFGSYSFQNFIQNKAEGSILLTIYLFISIVLLLNFMVSLTSYRFNQVFSRGKLEVTKYAYNKQTGWITSFPPPFNVILFPFLFLIPFVKAEKLNKLCMRLGYSVYVLIFTFMFIVLSIFYIPLAYLKIAVQIVIDLLVRISSKKLKRYDNRQIIIKILQFVTWLLIGNFYLVYILISNDIIIFVYSLFNIYDNREKQEEIPLSDYYVIKKTIKNIYNNQIVEITLDDIKNYSIEQFKCMHKFIQNEDDSQQSKSKSSNSFSAKNLADKKDQKISLNSANLEQKFEFIQFLKEFQGLDPNINIIRANFLLEQLKFCNEYEQICFNQTLTKQDKINLKQNLLQYLYSLEIEQAEYALEEVGRDKKLLYTMLNRLDLAAKNLSQLIKNDK